MQSRSLDKKSLYRLRWLMLGTALLLAAIGGANALILAQLHQSTLREAQKNLLRQSLDLSELAERTLQAADLVLVSVVERATAAASGPDGPKELESEAIHVFLKEKVSGLPQLHGIGLVRPDGIRANYSGIWPIPRVDHSEREYFAVLKANPKLPLFVSAPIRGIVSGSWVIIIARPLLLKDGTFAGVAFATIDMPYFQELFRATSLGDGYAATFVRDDGTLLTRYPMAGETGTIVPSAVLGGLTRSRSAVTRSISPLDDEPRVAAAYRLLHYPFVVVVSQSERSVFAAWRTTALTIALITALMAVAIVAAAFLIARSWRQQERLTAARADLVEADKVRALAEAELQRQRDVAEHSMRFTAAVENMTHGLCVFDEHKRLVVCNEPFAAMYHLPAELRKPGTPFATIIAYQFFGNGERRNKKTEAALQR